MTVYSTTNLRVNCSQCFKQKTNVCFLNISRICYPKNLSRLSELVLGHSETLKVCKV